MPERLPDIPRSRGGELRPVASARVAREARKAELEVYRYKLESAVLREKTINDVETLRDVLSVATDEELEFLDEFRTKANGSATAREIVARKLEIFDSISNRVIARRFRG